jgi:hypothetical protein
VGYGLQRVKPQQQADLVRYRGVVELVNLRSALTDGYNLHYTNNPGEGRGGPGGTCFGDSGGPVLYDNTNIVVAVNSFVLNTTARVRALVTVWISKARWTLSGRSSNRTAACGNICTGPRHS